MQRFSEKRQAIMESLRETKEHPGAEWLYLRLKPRYPDISLATVYRNLSQLRDAGLIISVGMVDGEERFDADVTPHDHAVCEKCGRVADIFGFGLSDKDVRRVCMTADFAVIRSGIRYSGVCRTCAEKENR